MKVAPNGGTYYFVLALKKDLRKKGYEAVIHIVSWNKRMVQI